MNATPSADASVVERNLKVSVNLKGAVFLKVREAAAVLQISHKYLQEKLGDPTHRFSQLAPFFKDLNGGVGKRPMWRIAYEDLKRFQDELPSMTDLGGAS